jgi:hypothetical protein
MRDAMKSGDADAPGRLVTRRQRRVRVTGSPFSAYNAPTRTVVSSRVHNGAGERI